ncbi:fungal pheromone mating factor STE2 GPCR-domain-containing protein [Coniella lustricola]|uniref:Fungal pheromone mating factor STE2 GPCR-domain-containing protein n=1 Tax=Coniella lustricola TaxID=2025994 RepID=A0A2T3AH66_9PEZI|nr:fungal pheromone mating factor STE2 GPCR-domain-containing protein [Coniella lustricola]
MVVRCTGYGVEIGASIVMLAVILTMTPKTKFWRFPTYLNIASICNNIVRVVLLAVYFDSSWVTFYALYGDDYSYVTRTDYATSIASTALTIPQNILMMAALMLQAWSMIKLWPDKYRFAVLIWSFLMVLLEIGFMAASAANQIIQLGLPPAEGYALIMKSVWIRYCFLGFEVACICWFCALFISKLVVHLWQNRSFLPTAKGLGAMDALVMTNGVLMLIPVFFASLQYSWSVRFESGSLLYTSVLVVLPLGTMVAQRIADPAAFNSELSATARVTDIPRDRFEEFTTRKTSVSPGTWSQSSHESDRAFRIRHTSESNAPHGTMGVTATVSSVGYYNKLAGGALNPNDIELEHIEVDVEAGCVRVEHEVQQSAEIARVKLR